MSTRKERMDRPELTDLFCKSVKPKAETTEYHDGSTRLALRVSPNGAKSWTMRYRNAAGQQKRLTLGPYGVKDGLGLKDARAKYSDLSNAIRNGADPTDEAKATKFSAKQTAAAETVLDVGTEYFEACEAGKHKKKVKHRKKPTTLAQEKSAFHRDLVPALGKRKLGHLSPDFIQQVIDKIESERSEGAARQARKVLHSIYVFALWKRYVTTNSCSDVTYPDWRVRRVTLTDDEIRHFWRACETLDSIPDLYVSTAMGICIQLTLVLGQRCGEIASMKVSELDLDQGIWRMPWIVTKNRRDHIVPLPPLAVALIKRALSLRSTDETDAVFPSPKDRKKSVLRAAPSRAFMSLKKAVGLNHLRLHDTRRTAASRMASPPCRVPHFIISKVLNHTSDTGGAAEVTFVYNQYEYYEEKLDALSRWETQLLSILRQEAVRVA